MNPKHHPDISTLMSYSAGSLPTPLAAVVACHLANCQHCRTKLLEAEQIGSRLLNDITPTPVSSSVKKSLLDQLDDLEPANQAVKRSLPKSNDLPLPLNALLGKDLRQLEWKSLVPGIKQYVISSSSEGQLRLLNISPGTCIPAHSHTGAELTQILKGSITDETGQYCAGDMADMGPEVKHQPVVDTGEECICLIATDAPLLFTNWIPRLLQPFFGI